MTYEFRTRPYEHQREGLRFLLGCSVGALLMEMGTGKTKVAIDEISARFLRGEIDTAVVLPPKSIMHTWLDQISEHMPQDVRDMAWVEAWVAGGGNKREAARLEALATHSGLRVLVMNIEALSTSGRALEFLKRFAGSRTAVYVDESTTIGNVDSKRHRNLVRILGEGRSAIRRIMTGSLGSDPLRVFGQFQFLRSGILGTSNFFAFRAKYCVTREIPVGARKQIIVVGTRNIPELRERIAPHGYRVLKKDCLDLPEKVYVTRHVPLTEEQERHYLEVKRHAFTVIGEGEIVSPHLIITQMMRLQQILAGYVRTDDGGTVMLPGRRIDVLLEVLWEVAGKAVVWCNHRTMIPLVAQAIEEEFGAGSSAQFHGGNADVREVEAHRFVNVPGCRFMLSTQQAGGRGQTWVVANTVVYYSNSFDLEHRMQSEDRCHRIGQHDRVTYVDLLAHGTIDERVLGALRSKIDVATAMLGETPEKWVV